MQRATCIFNARTRDLDVRYRSLPLLTEMADGLPFAPLIDETSSSYRLTTLATDLSPTASVRYSPLLAADWRPTAGLHRCHAARNGHISISPPACAKGDVCKGLCHSR